jgi:hypothetical protein
MQYSNPMLAIEVLSQLQDELNKSFSSKTKSIIRKNKKKKKNK